LLYSSFASFISLRQPFRIRYVCYAQVIFTLYAYTFRNNA
jgi:hypothetical protein